MALLCHGKPPHTERLPCISDCWNVMAWLVVMVGVGAVGVEVMGEEVVVEEVVGALVVVEI